MKRKLLYPFLIILSVLLLVIAYCKKEAVVPAVTTSPISTFSSKAALAGGIVTDNGGASYINAGVCWNKTSGPTIQ